MGKDKGTKVKQADLRSAASDEALNTVDVTQETLDATPARLLTFLRGVGTRPPIMHALEAVGYDADEHQRGWALLHACSGYRPVASIAPVVNQETIDAINTLDAQDERIFAITTASLEHRAPQARAALLSGVAPGQGAESVVFFDVLLDRLEQLGAGRLEGVSKDQARVANEVLIKRGLTTTWRTGYRALVKRAQRYASPTSEAHTSGRDEASRKALLEARAFYEEWSQIAHKELTRKDYLIALGLATRKSPTRAGGEPVPAAASAQPTGVDAAATRAK